MAKTEEWKTCRCKPEELEATLNQMTELGWKVYELNMDGRSQWYYVVWCREVEV